MAVKAEMMLCSAKLDNGGRVLVKGKCPVSAASQTAGAASMGDDATVELSAVAGRNVLRIRSGIISDQTALRALQEYITTQCLSNDADTLHSPVDLALSTVGESGWFKVSNIISMLALEDEHPAR